MHCKECDKPVCKKAPGVGLCRLHYDRYRASQRLDELQIVECAKGCGRRIHNIPGLVLPGIPQGCAKRYTICRGCSFPPVLKGNSSQKGANNNRSKLTDQNVLDMRAAHANGVGNDVLAHKYGITKAHVQKIIRRERWAHI